MTSRPWTLKQFEGGDGGWGSAASIPSYLESEFSTCKPVLSGLRGDGQHVSSLCFPAICSSGSRPEVPLSFWNPFHCSCSSIFPMSILVARADGPFFSWHLSGYSGRHRCPSGVLGVRLHESFVSSFVVASSGVSIPGRTFSVLCVYCCVLGIITDQFFVIPFINFCTR